MSKIEIGVKNRFYFSKIEIGQQVNFLSKIEFYVNKRNFVKNIIFCQQPKLLSKIEFLVNKRNFCQKSKLMSNINILVKNRKKFSKIEICVKIEFFVNGPWNIEFWRFFRRTVTYVKKSKKLFGIQGLVWNRIIFIFWKLLKIIFLNRPRST